MISYGAKTIDSQAGLLKARKPKSSEKSRLKSVAIPIDAPVATTTEDPIVQIGSGRYNSTTGKSQCAGPNELTRGLL